MKQSAIYDLLAETVIITSEGEKGTLKKMRARSLNGEVPHLCWLIDFEVRGLVWVSCDEVQTYELV